jgi:hypothetical protein
VSFTDIANRALIKLGITKQLSDVSTDTSTTATIMYALQDTALRKSLIAADWDFATWIADLTVNDEDPADTNEWTYAYDMPTSPECVKPRRIMNGDRNSTPWGSPPFRVVANIGQRYTITGATAASPVVITTSATHSIDNGDTVYIEGVVGMTNINGLRFTAASVANTTVSLSGINGTAYTAYSSGGYIQGAGALLYTDEEDAALEYTRLVTDTDLYPYEFSEAMACMWAYLAAPALTGGDSSGLGQKAFQLFQREVSTAIARDANKRQTDEPPASEFTRNR